MVQTTNGLGGARVYKKTGDVVSYRSVFEARPPKFTAFNAEQSFAF